MRAMQNIRTLGLVSYLVSRMCSWPLESASVAILQGSGAVLWTAGRRGS